LISGDLSGGIVTAIQLSRATMQNIRQNLFLPSSQRGRYFQSLRVSPFLDLAPQPDYCWKRDGIGSVNDKCPATQELQYARLIDCFIERSKETMLELNNISRYASWD